MSIFFGCLVIAGSAAPFYLACGSTLKGHRIGQGINLTLMSLHLVGFWIGMSWLLGDVGTAFLGTTLLTPVAWGFLRATAPSRFRRSSAETAEDEP